MRSRRAHQVRRPFTPSIFSNHLVSVCTRPADVAAEVQSPEDSAGWFSRATFGYASGLIQPLQHEHLWQAAASNKADSVAARFQAGLQATVGLINAREVCSCCKCCEQNIYLDMCPPPFPPPVYTSCQGTGQEHDQSACNNSMVQPSCCMHAWCLPSLKQ